MTLKKHKRLERQVKLGLVGNYYWWRRYTEAEQFIVVTDVMFDGEDLLIAAKKVETDTLERFGQPFVNESDVFLEAISSNGVVAVLEADPRADLG